MIIRLGEPTDADAIWAILEPVLRAAVTYALPADWNRLEALAYWFDQEHSVFVAEHDGRLLGTYYIQANQKGGGAHVANCAYMIAAEAAGRGVGSLLCAHSLGEAATRGFQAMQFNFVVSTNTRAIALWRKFGFSVVGVLPRAFLHPASGLVDALVMFREGCESSSGLEQLGSDAVETVASRKNVERLEIG